MKYATALSLALLSAGLAPRFPRPVPTTHPLRPPRLPLLRNRHEHLGRGSAAPARHRHGRGFVLGELTAKLNLTPAQQKTVGDILSSSESQMKALRGDDTLSQVDKRAKMQQINQLTRSQIRAALTPAQQAIFDTLPANGGRRGQQPPPEPTTPPAPTPPPSS